MPIKQNRYSVAAEIVREKQENQSTHLQLGLSPFHFLFGAKVLYRHLGPMYSLPGSHPFVTHKT